MSSKKIDMNFPVELVCREHGTFLVTPSDHLGQNREQLGYGCPKCGDVKSLMRGLKIEEGIPVPPRSYSAGRPPLPVWMKVGDSVLCKTKHEAVKINSALRKNGMKSLQRVVSDGIRVWRI